jgi:hypothetical protein
VFSDELIRAAVRAGQYSDPKAEKYLGDVLIKRRDKILALYLPAINPIVNPRLDTSGRLTMDISADLAAFPTWKQPIRTHFRRTAQGWELVGLERLPETVPAAQTLQGES